MSNADVLWLAGLVLLALVVVGVLVKADAGHARRERMAAAGVAARMVERERPTVGGGLCLAGLLLWNAGGIVALLRYGMGVALVPWALVWIAGNQVLGLGATLGRERHYEVRRPQDDPGAEPPGGVA